jgi:hypothetical protein
MKCDLCTMLWATHGTASNSTLSSEEWIGKDVEGTGYVTILNNTSVGHFSKGKENLHLHSFQWPLGRYFIMGQLKKRKKNWIALGSTHEQLLSYLNTHTHSYISFGARIVQSVLWLGYELAQMGFLTQQRQENFPQNTHTCSNTAYRIERETSVTAVQNGSDNKLQWQNWHRERRRKQTDRLNTALWTNGLSISFLFIF